MGMGMGIGTGAGGGWVVSTRAGCTCADGGWPAGPRGAVALATPMNVVGDNMLPTLQEKR
jgi:hypothetical protein